MLFEKRTFAFHSLVLLLAIDGVFSQIDSYLVGIYRNQNEISAKKSKWSKNDANSDSCGGIFREKQVLIKSPNYPNNYLKNANCEYIFYSPFVCINEFHIQFLDFQLEPSLSCSKDRVVIGTSEVLCGQVIGIMKYKAVNGTLRIRFTTDQTIENKGFELLVTRLPCDSADQSVAKNANETFPLRVSHTIRSPSVSVVQSENQFVPIEVQTPKTVSIPRFESASQTSVKKPLCVKSNGLWRNAYPPTITPSTPFIPALPTLASCCVNIYNQPNFYLISPDFPNVARFPNDCLFYVERSHPNVCRLRIEFKYFLLGDWQQPQQQQHCTHSFLEIDGKRFCGCKTGTVYRTQWGTSPKSIRFTNLLQFNGIQGFILEITQEPCPYRISLPLENVMPSNQRVAQNYLTHQNDPRRCSLNYFSWLNFNTNQEMLAKSICIRNFG